MRARSTADSAGLLRQVGLPAAALLFGLQSIPAFAQMGPVDSSGFVEYRYNSLSGEGIDRRSFHGAVLNTNLATFFWRPWILNTVANFSVAQRNGQGAGGEEDSASLYGTLRLNFLARSRFPLTIYYDDLDGSFDSDVSSRSGRTRHFGAIQQYSSRRLGSYSFEWVDGSTDTLYQDGFRLPEKNDTERWQFLGRKAFGRNLITVNSRSLVVDSQIPERRSDSLRHTLNHSFRIGPRFDVRNTAFYTNEELDSAMIQSDRTYRQVSSVTTWRPGVARRLLITGRGLFQESTIRNAMTESAVQTMSLSGTANYQVSDRVTLTGGLGFLATENDQGVASDTSFQRIGASYNSINYPLGEGTYRYFGQASLGNRSNPGDMGEGELQDLGTTLGHSYTRTLETPGRSRWDLKVTQRVTTVHDTAGRERNSVQHGFSMTNGVRSGATSRYFRASLLDQRDFADEPREYQLLNLQYNLQGQISRTRSWTANALVQYGRRVQQLLSVEDAENTSVSYSVNASYRHMGIFDVQNLTFTSDLRWASEDYRSEDPFDRGFALETDRLNSSWRNRLEYRIGLLQLRADADLREVNGMWSAAVLVTARRYFGMR